MITHSKLATTDAMQADVDFFHEAFADWLADPDITVACGLWSDGAILELVPEGQASLLPAAYDGCFSCVRALRLSKRKFSQSCLELVNLMHKSCCKHWRSSCNWTATVQIRWRFKLQGND